jgi:hypothetical protein
VDVLAGHVPQPRDENVRLNLRLFAGQAPSHEGELEVAFSGFEFEPL